MIKVLKKLGIEAVCLNIVKVIYYANIMPNREKQSISFKIKTETKASTLSTLIQYIA
jgi:hypothetical protein